MDPKVKRLLVILLLLTIVAMLLAGCVTPPATPTTTPTPTLSPTPKVTPTPPVTSTPPPTPTPTTPALPPNMFPERPEAEILKELVINSDLIVAGTITDLRYEVVTRGQGNTAGKFAYTVFTLTVETVIKGEPGTKEVFIRVEGGMIGLIFQGTFGYSFNISDRVLICLQRGSDGIYTILPRGLRWMRGKIVGDPSDIKEVISRIVQVMQDNNIPVSLPAGGTSALPPGTESTPKK